MFASKFLERLKKELMIASKEQYFSERLVQLYFAKLCSSGKRAVHLFSVAEKAKKRFPVVYTRTLFVAPLVAFCAFDPLFAVSVSSSLYSPE